MGKVVRLHGRRKPRLSPRQPPRAPALFWPVALISAGVTGLMVVGVGPMPTAKGLANSLNFSCWIKGNISVETGERIYHMPGQEYYAATRGART